MVLPSGDRSVGKRHVRRVTTGLVVAGVTATVAVAGVVAITSSANANANEGSSGSAYGPGSEGRAPSEQGNTNQGSSDEGGPGLNGGRGGAHANSGGS